MQVGLKNIGYQNAHMTGHVLELDPGSLGIKKNRCRDMLVCLVTGWFIWFLTLREYDITRSLHKQGGCLDVHPGICSINTQPLRVTVKR
jgi:hypothetical protein